MSINLRRCIGCRQMKEKSGLLRILRTPAGEFVFDEKGNKDGRGAYICKDKACIELAIKKRGLNQSFHGKVDNAAYEILNEIYKGIEDETG